MLDITLLREQSDKVKKGIAAKNADPKLVDDFLALDEEWRKLTKTADETRAEQKKLSEKRDIEGGKKKKEEIKALEEKIGTIEKERTALWLTIPNLPSDDTPVGKDENENKVLRKSGEPRKFDFEPKDHLTLGEKLGIIDAASAGKITGSRFAYLKGDAATFHIQGRHDVQVGTRIIQSQSARLCHHTKGMQRPIAGIHQ